MSEKPGRSPIGKSSFGAERQVSLHNGSPFKTGYRHTEIRNARSIPDIQMSSLNVSYGVSISMIAAAAPATNTSHSSLQIKGQVNADSGHPDPMI
jgi:hypothetical protein